MVRLICPTMEYKETFEKGLLDMQDYYPGMLHAIDIQNMGLEAFIEYAKNMETRKEDGKVPSSELWIMDGDEFIGAISIRHKLNDYLKEIGGHIGLAIRASKRRQGYARKAMLLALDHLKQMEIKKALVTCDEDNVGSRKTIESCGGVLQDIVDLPEKNPGKKTMRFWIDIT